MYPHVPTDITCLCQVCQLADVLLHGALRLVGDHQDTVVITAQVLAAPNMGRTMNITEADALECWGKLESAIQQIHDRNASHLSFEELYRRAYTLVLHRYGAMLYTGFENSLRNQLKNVRAKFTDKSGMAFVSEVLAQWSTYHKSTQMIRDILMVRDH